MRSEVNVKGAIPVAVAGFGCTIVQVLHLNWFMPSDSISAIFVGKNESFQKRLFFKTYYLDEYQLKTSKHYKCFLSQSRSLAATDSS